MAKKAPSKKPVSQVGMAGGAAAGAAAGALLGPVGAALGAVVGGVAGSRSGISLNGTTMKKGEIESRGTREAGHVKGRRKVQKWEVGCAEGRFPIDQIQTQQHESEEIKSKEVARVCFWFLREPNESTSGT